MLWSFRLFCLHWAFVVTSFGRSSFLAKLARNLPFLMSFPVLRRHFNRFVRLRDIFVNLPIFLHHLLSLSWRNRRNLFLFGLYGIKMFFLKIDAKESLEVIPIYPKNRVAHQALINQLVQNTKFLGNPHSPLFLELLAVCAKGVKLI